LGDKGQDTAWSIEKGKDREQTLRVELARFNGGLHIHDRQAKYAAMTESPFAFYRGAAHLFYRDLHAEEMLDRSSFHKRETVTWVQGDLHLDNFGAFCDGEGDIVFDLNDFDESWIAPYLYDLWRGATSLVLTARLLDFDRGDEETFVAAFCAEYLKELARAQMKEGRNLDKITAANSKGTLRKFLKKAELKNSRLEMLDDWTVVHGGIRYFDRDNKDLAPVDGDDYRIVTSAVAAYKDHLANKLEGDEDYFEVLDVAARHNAGLGSLGVPRYYVLIRGEDDHPDSCRILDLKQQGLPSFFIFLQQEAREELLHHFDEDRAGFRVAKAQKCMLMDPDRHLGGFTILGRSFSVRERSPFKKKLKVKKLKKHEDFHEMSHHWGTILAAAHARADRDFQGSMVKHLFENEVLAAVDGRDDAFIEEVTRFARSYADQVEEDHALFERVEKNKLL
jgi:uncharacterized protein (DUF2252 family)